MSYRNLIDKALEAAHARANTPVETAKIASAPDALIKEAMDVAGALEFVSLSATGGDRAAGFREEMIREFYKTASSGNPANGPTAASGTQGIAPAAGKTKLAPKGLVGGNAPAQSTVSAATKDGDKAMLESFKQAGGQSLYDILMGNKTAAAGGPAEHDSETSAGVGTSNENSTYRKTLHSNEGPVNANRRDLKKSTRARLAEAFAHTGDTLGDATAAQIFPQAAARGSLKIAMDPRAATLRAYLSMPSKEAGAVGGALLGSALGAATADKDERKKGAIRGAIAGGTVGAIGKRIRSKKIDETVGKKHGLLDGFLKGVDIGMEAQGNPNRAASLSQKYSASVAERNLARDAAYKGRKLKGATAGAVAATGTAAGLSTRSRNKKSSDE